MEITCISDLHGHYPKLEGGDLLIIAGDFTARDTQYEYVTFFTYLEKQNYKKIIFIGGNHDNQLERSTPTYPWNQTVFSISHKNNIEYLCDSGTEFEGLKIWGSPWTLSFQGMNQKCKAFTCETEKELAEKWKLIPDDIDILITHSPPYGILDKAIRHDCFSMSEPPIQLYEHAGSKSLYSFLKYVERPKLHVFGHIHEAYGQKEVFHTYNDKMMISINCSYVNELYQPVNKPVKVIL